MKWRVREFPVSVLATGCVLLVSSFVLAVGALASCPGVCGHVCAFLSISSWVIAGFCFSGLIAFTSRGDSNVQQIPLKYGKMNS